MKLILVVALFFAGIVHAETPTEKVLRLRLEEAQSELQSAAKERAAMAATLARLKADSATRAKAVTESHTDAQVAASSAQAGAEIQADLLKKAADEAKEAAERQAKLTKETADKAAADAAEARREAGKMSSSNVALIIVQIFVFLALIAGFVDKQWTRKADDNRVDKREKAAEEHRLDAEQRAEKIATDAKQAVVEAKTAALNAAEAVSFSKESSKVQMAKLEQVHHLVDGNLTAAKQEELNALQSYLVLLEETVDSKKQLNLQPASTTLAAIENTRRKVSELSAQLEERARLNKMTEQKVAQDIKKADPGPEISPTQL